MKEKTNEVTVNEKQLKDKIYIIRGQKVMLDSDLAKIYGYTTKRFNEQVQRNIEKFDEDFMFQLTNDETANLSRCNFSATINEELSYSSRCQFGTSISRSQIATSIMQTKGTKGGRVYRPYVFSEQGIYMLMTVLKGPLAIKQSKSLIRLFKYMKDIIYDNKLFIGNEIELRTSLLEKEVKENKEHIKQIRIDLNKMMNNFIDPNMYKEFVIFDGKKLDADKAYKTIYESAEKSIIYVDDYIGIKTLDLLRFAKDGVIINIISDNIAKNTLRKFMVDDFISQKPSNTLLFNKTLNTCHDRFIVIDFNTKNKKIYHCGASSKDAGKKISVISLLNINDELDVKIKKFLKNPKLIIK